MMNMSKKTEKNLDTRKENSPVPKRRILNMRSVLSVAVS